MPAKGEHSSDGNGRIGETRRARKPISRPDIGRDFVDPIGMSQPTVSHHLKVLGKAGLVVGNRRGKWVWYSLVPERLAALHGALRV